MTVVEMTRFTVAPESTVAFLESRPAAVAALRSQVPGLISIELMDMGGGEWMDLVQWTDHSAAAAAQQQVESIPEVGAMFALIAELVSMEHGEVQPVQRPARVHG